MRLAYMRLAYTHILNNCATARDLRRYNARHDSVLQEIASVVKPYTHESKKTHLPPLWEARSYYSIYFYVLWTPEAEVKSKRYQCFNLVG